GRVLWALTHGHTGHAPPLCGRAAGQCRDGTISGVVDRPVGGGREERPVVDVTPKLLGWWTDRLAAEGKTALLMVWDNASWHVSHAVRVWLKAHNRRVKQEGGCGIVGGPLPGKSPGLNRIEPKWVHGKRAIAEPDRKLSVAELKHRICAYYDCELLEPIAQKVA